MPRAVPDDPPDDLPGYLPDYLPDDPPPVLGEWRRVYIVVLAYEALVIALFYVFTHAFS